MESAMKFKKAYTEREPVLASIGETTQVQQSMAADCDINNIMKKYEKTGVLQHVARYGGSYGDFTVLPDFHTAMNKMIEAQEMFMSLPASIREKFNNDAGAFVEFAVDEKNIDEMRKMGLSKEAPKKSEPAKPAKKEPDKPAKKEPEEPAPDQ
ncbi:internal scaffolding protein [Microviridae sp.]|nr:internal scaffolding protein [Microviridae sp.]